MKLTSCNGALLATALAFSGHAASAQDYELFGYELGSPEAELAVVDQKRIDALEAADVEALDKLLADEFIHVSSSGRVQTKEQHLANTGRRDYDLQFRYIENRVIIDGNMGMVQGHYWSGRDETDGREARHLRVWIKRDGRWQMLAHQATSLPTVDGE